MSRYPDLDRSALDPAGQVAWDAIAGSRGGVRGPYAPLIAVPTLAERIAHLGTYLRFEGLLAGADRELAILVVARELRAKYEWFAHEPIARREGARGEAIAAIATNGPIDALTEHERVLVSVVRALYRDRRVPDELYAAAQSELGQERLVELVGLVGYYGMIGFVLNAFDVGLPDGATVPF